MKSHTLPFIQGICLDLYINCKARSKKDHGLPLRKRDEGYTPDEELIYFMLKNSSITESDPNSPRCFTKMSSAIHLMCRQLCPGQWCTRTHCKSHSGHCAYHCGAGKRPATCNLYKDYIEKKKRKENTRQNAIENIRSFITQMNATCMDLSEEKIFNCPPNITEGVFLNKVAIENDILVFYGEGYDNPTETIIDQNTISTPALVDVSKFINDFKDYIIENATFN